MDKLTAAKILGVEYDSPIEDIRDAFRAQTEEINLEDDPQGFALVHTAYRTLTRPRGSAGLSITTDSETELPAGEDSTGYAVGLGSEAGETGFFAGIEEEEARRDREEYDRREARMAFRSLLEEPRSDYDYVKLLEHARICELDRNESASIAKQLTTVYNLIRKGENRVRRTEGFDEFVAYLYSRMGKTYHPIWLRVRNWGTVLIAAYFAIPASAGIIQGLVESITGDLDKMEGMADKASYIVMIGTVVLFIVGLVIILRKTVEMRRVKRRVIIFAFIVACMILDYVATLITYSLLE